MKKIKTTILLSLLGLTLTGACIGGVTYSSLAEERQEQKYSVLFLEGNGFTYENITGINLDTDSVGDISNNGTITFTVNLLENFYKESGYSVTLNDVEITPDNDIYTAVITRDSIISVNGVTSVAPKYRVSTSLCDGVTIEAEGYSANYDGSFIVNRGVFDFSIIFNKGYAPTSGFQVLADNNLLTLNDSGLYSLNVINKTFIEVKGVAFAKHSITFDSGNLFSIYDIKGARITENQGEIANGETLSFKVSKSLIAEGTLVVKNNGETLSPNNGVYSIDVTGNVNITIDGLAQIGEVLANQTASKNKGNISIKETRRDINFAGGFSKSFLYSGSWLSTPQLCLAPIDTFEKYNELVFSVNCLDKSYFEMYAADGVTTASMNYEGWTNVYIVRQEDSTYRVFKGTKDANGYTPISFQEKDFITSFGIKINGTYYISELVAFANPNYVDPHHTLDDIPFIDATPIAGTDTFKLVTTYNVKYAFADINPLKYKSIAVELSVAGITGDKGYYGLGTSPVVSKDLQPNSKNTITISKNDDDTFEVLFNTFSFGSMDIGSSLSNLKFMAHAKDASKVTFTVSKFVVEDDPEYVEGPCHVTIVDNANHISYSVTGQSNNEFDVDFGSTINLDLTIDSAYLASVTVNGEDITNEDDTYELKITRDTTIVISETLKPADYVSLGCIFADKGVALESDEVKIPARFNKVYKVTSSSFNVDYMFDSSIDISSYNQVIYMIYGDPTKNNSNSYFMNEMDPVKADGYGAKNTVGEWFPLTLTKTATGKFTVNFTGKDRGEVSSFSDLWIRLNPGTYFFTDLAIVN